MHAVATLYYDIVPSSCETHVPTIEEIIRVQERTSPQEGVVRDSEEVGKNHGVIWISDDTNELKLHMLVGAHCGEAGHRGGTVTVGKIREAFWWSGMTQDVREFVAMCIHSLVSNEGEKFHDHFIQDYMGSIQMMSSIWISCSWESLVQGT